MTTENSTCNICGRSTLYSPCALCGNDQFCQTCNQCNICGPKPGIKAAFEVTVGNRSNKALLTLRKLRDRLTDIIDYNDRGAKPERNDLPVYLDFGLERGRGSWYVPVDFVGQHPLGIGIKPEAFDVYTLKGREDHTIKSFQRRATRNSGRSKK